MLSAFPKEEPPTASNTQTQPSSLDEKLKSRSAGGSGDNIKVNIAMQ